MNIFVAPSDLTDRASDDGLIALAQTLIERIVCPDVPEGLAFTNRSVTLRLIDELPAPLVPSFGWNRVSARRLKAWPITGLTSVTVDGVDVTSSITWDRFGLERNTPYYQAFSPYSVITVAFSTGFKNDGAEPKLPNALRQAITELARIVQISQNGLDSKKLGDAQVVWSNNSWDSNGSGLVLPATVRSLIAPWVLESYA